MLTLLIRSELQKWQAKPNENLSGASTNATESGHTVSSTISGRVTPELGFISINTVLKTVHKHYTKMPYGKSENSFVLTAHFLVVSNAALNSIYQFRKTNKIDILPVPLDYMFRKHHFSITQFGI